MLCIRRAKIGGGVANFLWGLVLSLLLVGAAWGQATAPEYQILLDTDNNPTTGCTVATSQGDVSGIEQRLITTVAIGTSAAAVSGVQLQTCGGGVFGAAGWSDAGGWPVGIGNGTDGAAVIETYLPLARLTGAGPVRVGVISSAGQVADALTGGADGQPLVLALNGNGAGDPSAIPVLNPWTLGLLIALLGGALRWGRRWPGATRLLVLVVVMAGAGLAWAAFVRDGQTSDWAGVAPLATQNSTVTGPSKIVALFGKAEGGNLNFRIDAGITVTAPPTNQAPQVNAGTDQTITLPANQVALTGTVTDDGLPNPPATVTITWSKDSGPGTVTFGNANAASTTATFSVAGTYVLRLTASDSDKSAFDTVTITVNPAGGGTLPPDPETVAPPVDPTVATTTYAATQFLYTGSNPIQTGVAEGTIDPKRTAVLRGRVLDKQNNPLSGVTMTILNHPEFGQTLSRADGGFDLAVNGGGWLTVTYQKTGYLPAQRQVNAPWQDFVVLDDTVLIARDAQATTVDLTQPTFQVAQGSPVTDGDGTRQATLLIPPGTTAQAYNPDGSLRTVTSLTLHLTEYTVVANGPQSMPAPLPANVGYTYAVEISADEATIKKDGKDVVFNQPVPFYVDNFLNFPVGSAVPVGYYDSTKGAWIPYDNGRIIKILSISGGLAQLDVTGSGAPADAAALAALGITDAERAKLASLYAAGASLWRVQLAHLSTWDCNWPFGPPPDAQPPKKEPKPKPKPKPCPKGQCCPEGENTASGNSVIGCESQTLSESIPLVGTGLALHYSIDQVPGNVDERTLNIPLSDATIPASLKRIEASVSVAGRLFDLGTFPAQANQTTTFTWDGQDAYGQTLQGTQPATVKIGYVYDGVYQSPVRFGASSGVAITGNRTRQEVTLWRNFETSVGIPDLKQIAVAGWSLDVHHVYDPVGKVLYQGDGSRRSAQGRQNGIITFLPTGGDGYTAAVSQDGSLYIAGAHLIKRLSPNSAVTTVAGTGSAGFSGDGGPATQAMLNRPTRVAFGADGSLYFCDAANYRVRRIGPDGIITTVAGTGSAGFSGDGGPALQAQFTQLGARAGGIFNGGIAVGPDSSLYIVDGHSVRRVTPDGIINTVAGINPGEWGGGGDGGPATQAKLYGPGQLALGPDGSLYIADTVNGRIRRVGLDGIITTVAAGLDWSSGLAVDRDGSMYIGSNDSGIVRWVGPDGIITTVAGTGSWSVYGNGGPATQAGIGWPDDIAIAQDGSFYINVSYSLNFNMLVRHEAPVR